MAYREPLGWPRLSRLLPSRTSLAEKLKVPRHQGEKKCAHQTIEELTDEGHGNVETDDRRRPGDGDDSRLRCSAHPGLRRLHQARTGQAEIGRASCRERR